MAYEAENRFVQSCISQKKYFMSNHALERAFERKISMEDIINVLKKGRITKVNDDEGKMVYNNCDKNVVVALDIPNEIIIVTCYDKGNSQPNNVASSAVS